MQPHPPPKQKSPPDVPAPAPAEPRQRPPDEPDSESGDALGPRLAGGPAAPRFTSVLRAASGRAARARETGSRRAAAGR